MSEGQSFSFSSKNDDKKSKKLTGKDLEESFNKKVDEAKKSGKISRSIKYSFVGLCLASIGVLSILWTNNNQSTSAEMEVNNQTIVELQAKLDSMSDSNASIKTSDDIQRQIFTASEKGKRIADLQNQYSKIMEMPDGKDKDNTIKQEQNELKPFFNDSATTTFNPLSPWYIKSDPDSYSWTYASAYPTDDINVLRIIWLNTEKDSNKILAWAKAKYDTTNQEIVSIQVGRTLYGQKLVEGTTEDN